LIDFSVKHARDRQTDTHPCSVQRAMLLLNTVKWVDGLTKRSQGKDADVH